MGVGPLTMELGKEDLMMGVLPLEGSILQAGEKQYWSLQAFSVLGHFHVLEDNWVSHQAERRGQYCQWEHVL